MNNILGDLNIKPLNKEVIVTKDLEEFYLKCIEPTLPSVEIVQKWHSLLKQYVADPNAIYWIRDYASPLQKHNDLDVTDKKNYGTLRRGWLTQYNNCSYVFCDNSFSTIFYALTLNEPSPNFLNILLDSMKNRNFPYGETRFRDNQFEKPYQAFNTGLSVKKPGWKLSHLNPVKSEYTFAQIRKEYDSVFKDVFTRGSRKDWTKESNEYVRLLRSDLSEKHKEMLVAHFIRLVHPLNYFLTPSIENHITNPLIKHNDIGENEDLINLVKEKLKVRFSGTNIIKEFNELAKVVENKKATNKNIEISYGLSVSNMVKKKDKQLNKPSKKVDAFTLSSATIAHVDSKLPSEILLFFKSYNKRVEDGNPGKIGATAREVFEELNKYDKLGKTIDDLRHPIFSKETFKLTRAAFLKEDDFHDIEVNGGRSTERYYKDPIYIDNEPYYLTNDWYAPTLSSPKNRNNLQGLYTWANSLFNLRMVLGF